MGLQAQFAATPRLSAVSISTADTSPTTTPTNGAVLLTGGTSGTRISKIMIQATANTTAGIIRLWTKENTTYKLFLQIQVPAATMDINNASAFSKILSEVTNPNIFPIMLPNNTWSLYATTTVAQGFNIVTEGADL